MAGGKRSRRMDDLDDRLYEFMFTLELQKKRFEKMRQRRMCFDLICDFYDRAKAEGDSKNMEGAVIALERLTGVLTQGSNG